MVALLVVGTFIVALIIDALVRRARKGNVEPAKVYAAVAERRMPGFPAGYFFTPEHVWVNLRASGKVQVGIDELIGRLIGKADRIEMKKAGDKVRKGEILASVVQGDKTIHVVSPIEGTVEQYNYELEDHPEEFSENPYTRGWFYLINPTNLSSNLRDFSVADQTKSWWSHEINRLREFVQLHLPQPALAGLTYQDGGLPLDGLVSHFDRQAVQDFETQFLGYKGNKE
jgi:glycine cleavage system H lipoate-binding protein